jgi:hypothetical protein
MTGGTRNDKSMGEAVSAEDAQSPHLTKRSSLRPASFRKEGIEVVADYDLRLSSIQGILTAPALSLEVQVLGRNHPASSTRLLGAGRDLLDSRLSADSWRPATKLRLVMASLGLVKAVSCLHSSSGSFSSILRLGHRTARANVGDDGVIAQLRQAPGSALADRFGHFAYLPRFLQHPYRALALILRRGSVS